ncbi:hypothetical protein CWI37_0332p0020 [Hamiltosporidium tvaerminnensis]|uniref:Uncharacterized protein n=1 Tax=Hamiltosporidium tvaerminnensis TaxID=1176355 RepID=A0A4Q9L8Y7_9MICR|nr:hypothetical protein CWI37_0332p0020 [Hamiltosporidium tvaerminnensis]
MNLQEIYEKNDVIMKFTRENKKHSEEKSFELHVFLFTTINIHLEFKYDIKENYKKNNEFVTILKNIDIKHIINFCCFLKTYYIPTNNIKCIDFIVYIYIFEKMNLKLNIPLSNLIKSLLISFISYPGQNNIKEFPGSSSYFKKYTISKSFFVFIFNIFEKIYFVSQKSLKILIFQDEYYSNVYEYEILSCEILENSFVVSQSLVEGINYLILKDENFKYIFTIFFSIYDFDTLLIYDVNVLALESIAFIFSILQRDIRNLDINVEYISLNLTSVRNILFFKNHGLQPVVLNESINPKLSNFIKQYFRLISNHHINLTNIKILMSGFCFPSPEGSENMFRCLISNIKHQGIKYYCFLRLKSSIINVDGIVENFENILYQKWSLLETEIKSFNFNDRLLKLNIHEIQLKNIALNTKDLNKLFILDNLKKIFFIDSTLIDASKIYIDKNKSIKTVKFITKSFKINTMLLEFLKSLQNLDKLSIYTDRIISDRIENYTTSKNFIFLKHFKIYSKTLPKCSNSFFSMLRISHIVSIQTKSEMTIFSSIFKNYCAFKLIEIQLLKILITQTEQKLLQNSRQLMILDISECTFKNISFSELFNLQDSYDIQSLLKRLETLKLLDCSYDYECMCYLQYKYFVQIENVYIEVSQNSFNQEFEQQLMEIFPI